MKGTQKSYRQTDRQTVLITLMTYLLVPAVYRTDTPDGAGELWISWVPKKIIHNITLYIKDSILILLQLTKINICFLCFLNVLYSVANSHDTSDL
jgi:hypothetical protein